MQEPTEATAEVPDIAAVTTEASDRVEAATVPAGFPLPPSDSKSNLVNPRETKFADVDYNSKGSTSNLQEAGVGNAPPAENKESKSIEDKVASPIEATNEAAISSSAKMASRELVSKNSLKDTKTLSKASLASKKSRKSRNSIKSDSSAADLVSQKTSKKPSPVASQQQSFIDADKAQEVEDVVSQKTSKKPSPIASQQQSFIEADNVHEVEDAASQKTSKKPSPMASQQQSFVDADNAQDMEAAVSQKTSTKPSPMPSQQQSFIDADNVQEAVDVFQQDVEAAVSQKTSTKPSPMPSQQQSFIDPDLALQELPEIGSSTMTTHESEIISPVADSMDISSNPNDKDLVEGYDPAVNQFSSAVAAESSVKSEAMESVNTGNTNDQDRQTFQALPANAKENNREPKSNILKETIRGLREESKKIAETGIPYSSAEEYEFEMMDKNSPETRIISEEMRQIDSDYQLLMEENKETSPTLSPVWFKCFMNGQSRVLVMDQNAEYKQFVAQVLDLLFGQGQTRYTLETDNKGYKRLGSGFDLRMDYLGLNGEKQSLRTWKEYETAISISNKLNRPFVSLFCTVVDSNGLVYDAPKAEFSTALLEGNGYITDVAETDKEDMNFKVHHVSHQKNLSKYDHEVDSRKNHRESQANVNAEIRYLYNQYEEGERKGNISFRQKLNPYSYLGKSRARPNANCHPKGVRPIDSRDVGYGWNKSVRIDRPISEKKSVFSKQLEREAADKFDEERVIKKPSDRRVLNALREQARLQESSSNGFSPQNGKPMVESNKTYLEEQANVKRQLAAHRRKVHALLADEETQTSFQNLQQSINPELTKTADSENRGTHVSSTGYDDSRSGPTLDGFIELETRETRQDKISSSSRIGDPSIINDSRDYPTQDSLSDRYSKDCRSEGDLPESLTTSPLSHANPSPKPVPVRRRRLPGPKQITRAKIALQNAREEQDIQDEQNRIKKVLKKEPKSLNYSSAFIEESNHLTPFIDHLATLKMKAMYADAVLQAADPDIMTAKLLQATHGHQHDITGKFNPSLKQEMMYNTQKRIQPTQMQQNAIQFQPRQMQQKAIPRQMQQHALMPEIMYMPMAYPPMYQAPSLMPQNGMVPIKKTLKSKNFKASSFYPAAAMPAHFQPGIPYATADPITTQFYAQQYAAQMPMAYPPFMGQRFATSMDSLNPGMMPRNLMMYGNEPAVAGFPRTEQLSMPRKRREKAEPSNRIFY
ncbi:MAG: hypothetical protein SGCHY_003338 [Lobulomycetales sp.]